MRKLVSVAALLALVLPQGAGAEEASEDATETATEVVEVKGTATADGVQVSGEAVFGGQRPVWVAEDFGGDGPGMVSVGDYLGVDNAGIDLLGASLSVPDPERAELLVQWLVSNLPSDGGIPEGTRTSMAFRVDDKVFRVQAKFSNVAGPTTPDDPQGHAGSVGGAFQLLGNCTPSLRGTGIPHCDHLLWLEGGFDQRTGIISARAPLGSPEAPEIDFGVDLRRNVSEASELSKVIAGYHAAVDVAPLNDEADFGPPGQDGFAFPVPAKEVMLGIAEKGTSPHAVAYSAPAAVAAGDTFTGTISTEGFEPGTFDVFARACFATNCAIRSLEGVVVPGSTASAVLRLPERPDDPDHSFAFWRGGQVGNKLEHAGPAFPVAPGNIIGNCNNSPCFEHVVRVETPGAARLRIAMDTIARSHNYNFTITAPGGQTFGGANNNSFNREEFIASPAVGDYRILVRPFSARNSIFSLRAKLEAEIPTRTPTEDGLLPPDLQPTPPYELNFTAPINPANGIFPPDDINPPAAVGGKGPISCAADETFDDGSVRCLRFSFGLSNMGPGNFDVRWSGSSGIGSTGPMIQCVQRPGTSPMPRPAGEFEWHATHFHWHYKDIVELELLRVIDPQTGQMEQVGDGRKIGYSPADQSLADWFNFDQERQGTSGNAGTCQSGLNNRLGMSVGWGDVYRYQRPGNYVDFGTNLDGLYVIRLIVDPLNQVLEATTDNNLSYTYVEVTGLDIEVLEQGRGQSPWDPDKDVLTPRYPGGVPW